MTTKLDPQQQKTITDNAAKQAADTATQAAVTKAESTVDAKLKTAFGVDTVSLDEVIKSLRKKLLDDAIDFEEGTKTVADPNGTTPNATISQVTHRYTIFVPDKDEQSVFNMGHLNGEKELFNPGISARTKSHIHFHTTSFDDSSLISLGAPSNIFDQLWDEKSIVKNLKGITAVTNGSLWAESQGQLNLTSYRDQAVLRAQEQNVRVHAAKKSVELAAAKNVALGAVENVKIVANSSVELGDNAYGTPFGNNLIPDSIPLKDAITAADLFTSIQSIATSIKKKDSLYEPGKVSKKDKDADVAKLVVDGAKALSTFTRWVLGQAMNGQVKVAAQNFASISGGIGASMYGGLSATVSSFLSASVVGGTASLKGLKWTSVWAKSGVSVRTVNKNVGIKSDNNKVVIDGHEEVTVVSAGGLNMGGDNFVELKSLKGHAYISGMQAAVCAGGSSGNAVLLSPGGAHFGTVSDANKSTCAPKDGAFVKIGDGPEDHKGETKKAVSIESTEGIVSIKAKGSFMTFKNGKICASGKKITFE